MRVRYVVASACLLIGMIAVVQAQPGGGGFGAGPLGLINNKAVQEDLKVTEEQATKLKDFGKEFFPKIGEIYKDAGIEFGKGGFGKGMTDEQKAKMAEVNVKVSAETYKALGDILKKEQIERLKQIERQRMGVSAFTNAEVVSALKLTDSQKTSVKGISGDFDKERREIVAEANKDKKGKGGGFFLDPETQKKVDKLGKEATGKVVDLLDDTQKKKWKELIGAEFDLSKLQFQFGKKKD